MSRSVMLFDPTNGEPEPFPNTVIAYRKWHGLLAWLYNPYTGRHRDVRDIGSDVEGHLITPSPTDMKDKND